MSSNSTDNKRPRLSYAAAALLKGSGQALQDDKDIRGSRAGRQRNDMSAKDQAKLAERLAEKKALEMECPSGKHGAWLRSFVHETWPATKYDVSGFTRRRNICYRLLKKKADQEIASSGSIVSDFRQCLRESSRLKGRGYAAIGKHVARSCRKRMEGGGNKVLCPEVGSELWHWFVDTIRFVRARIGNHILLSKASGLVKEIEDIADKLVRDGVIVEADRPKLPKINRSWLARWRKRYRVSYKCTSIVYKVPKATLVKRLGVFWRNVIRIRYFHSKMFPNARLHYRSYDQKPLYFNQAGTKGTFASMDERDVEVRECDAATRMRFTVMSKSVSQRADETEEDVRARSSNSGDPHKIGVLFKTRGEGKTILAKLDVPTNALVQFGPKGSYRTESVLAWLEHDLGKADGNGNLELVFLDWFSAHLQDEVVDFIESQGHVPMFIPGGATPWVATLDTHYHNAYQREYMRLENLDNQQQLLDGAPMPSITRQTVLDRAADSWKLLDFEKMGRDSWIETGIDLPFDTSQNHRLRRQCRVFWDSADLSMDQVRDRIVAEIDYRVSVKELTSWSQWPSLLEKYDNHPGLTEGEECSRERMGDPDDEDEDDDDDDDDDDADEYGDDPDVRPTRVLDFSSSPHASDAENEADQDFPTYREGGSFSSSSASNGPLKSESEKHVSPSANGGKKRNVLDYLKKCLHILEEAKVYDPHVDKVIKESLRRHEKMEGGLHPAIRQEFQSRQEVNRVRVLQKRDEQRAAKEAKKKLDQELAKAKLDLKIAKEKKQSDAKAAQVRLAEIQAAKKLRAEQAEREKVRDRHIRMHFAVRLYDRLVAYVDDLNKPKNKQALDALTDRINRSIALKGYNSQNIVVPAFCTETSHLLANSQFLETVCWARLRKQRN